MSNDPKSGFRLAMSAGLASVLVAALLVALKLWALAETGALSIAASLADSAMDLMMSLGAAAAIIYAARPADEDHAFGHTSAEDLAALAQSAFILISAGLIGWTAVYRLTADTPHQLASEGRGLVVMVASILITLALVWWQGRVARQTGSKVVAADRLHYLGKDAWDALMDRAADPSIIEGIGRIAADWPGVRGYHDLKTRTAGSRIFVNLHIELDGDQSLRQAHDIGASLRRAILDTYPHADVIIHKDVHRET